MKKFLLSFVISASLMLFFVDCKKCQSKLLPDLIFSPEEISIVPYTDISSLTFKDSLGDSICYDRTAPLNTSMHNYQQHYNQSCIGDHRLVQEVDYILQCRSDTTYYIRIKLSFEDVFLGIKKRFDLYYYYHYSSESYYFDGEFLLENNAPANQHPLNPWCWVSTCYPSFTLQNHTYNSVYVMQLNDFPVTTVYYSISQGIVGYKEYLGKVWYLDKAY